MLYFGLFWYVLEWFILTRRQPPSLKGGAPTRAATPWHRAQSWCRTSAEGYAGAHVRLRAIVPTRL